MKFGIVWAEWNHTITHALMQGAYDTLIKHGAKPENIIAKTVPEFSEPRKEMYKPWSSTTFKPSISV